MVLKSHDLLTVNATIIAGLMILLSIQITNPFDKFLNEQNSLHDKVSNLQLEKDRLSMLLTSNFSINKNMSIDANGLKSTLTAKSVQLKETEIELNQTLEQMKTYDKDQMIVSSLQTSVITYEKIINMFMLLPFILSAIFEAGHAYLRKDFGDDSSKLSTVTMFVGFVSLALGLYLKMTVF